MRIKKIKDIRESTKDRGRGGGCGQGQYGCGKGGKTSNFTRNN